MKPESAINAQHSRTAAWLTSSLQDVRYGFTLLRRDGARSALIVLVLALGIGGNAAIFTLLKAAFLDPLPLRDSDRLMTVTYDNGRSPNIREALAIRARSRTIENLAFSEYRDAQLSGIEEPVRVVSAHVTASFFPVLGVSVSLGRTFVDEENQPGRTATVILSDAFWRARMASDPAAIGKVLRLDGEPAVVAGVLPPTFHFDYPTLGIAEPVDLYVPLAIETAAPFDTTWSGVPSRILTRLRPGATRAQAAAEIENIAGAMMRDYPEAYRDRDGGPRQLVLETHPLRDAIVGTQRSVLWILLGGVGILLLIACANTAQLLLARSLRREREVAVRVALGASRARLIQQFLLEGLVLAVCGGVAGLLFSGAVARLVVALLPQRTPLLESAQVDLRVAAFTVALAMLSTVLFAIVPAIKGSKWTPGPSLSARGASRERNRWGHFMVALEAALSVFLLYGAALVATNLWALVSTPMGFDPQHVLTFRLKVPAMRENSLDDRAALPLRDYLAGIAAIPGVDSAATVTGPPLRPTRGGPVELLGVTEETGKLKTVLTYVNIVSPDYFRTLRIPLLAGRTFRNDDVKGRPLVSVVNEEFARQFGLGVNIVGRQTYEPSEPSTIVGVVGNVRTRGLQTEAVPESYLSAGQLAWANPYVVVRSPLPSAQLIKLIENAIQSSNADQAIYGVQTMEDFITDSATQPRFHVFLIGTFAILALSTAAAGIYSVISCLVSQRTSEIAIRIALGAAPGAVIRTILGTTAAWALGGLTCGLAIGMAATNVIRSLSATAATGTPAIYAAVALLFLFVVLAAVYLPARRASRLDPSIALRAE